MKKLSAKECKRLEKVKLPPSFKLPPAAWFKKNEAIVNSLLAAVGYRIKLPSWDYIQKAKERLKQQANERRKTARQKRYLLSKGWTQCRDYGWNAPGRDGSLSIDQGCQISLSGAVGYQCAAEGHRKLIKNKDGSANCSHCWEHIRPEHMPNGKPQPRKHWLGEGSAWSCGYYDRYLDLPRESPYWEDPGQHRVRDEYLLGWDTADKELKADPSCKPQ